MKKTIIGILSTVLAGVLMLAPQNTYEANAFTEEEVLWIEEAQEALEDILEDKDVMALVYLADHYDVRSQASADSDVVVRVPGGQSVLVQDVELTEECEAWVKVKCIYADHVYEGYVQRANLACSDELFLQWEMNYGMNNQISSLKASNTYEDVEQFPASYQDELKALKDKHPNWIFVKMNTGLEWNTLVDVELNGEKGQYSLISTSKDKFLQAGIHSSGWAYPTLKALEYYLDPRNSLTEEGVFQFELLSYNETYHEGSEAALQSFLNNTFMAGNIPQTVLTYAHGFWAIGKELDISPFHLASRVYQEQGAGTSPLISGTYAGYEGYYNYYNFKASGITNKEIIENGLKYAKERNWNSPYIALYEGAKLLGSSYIMQGQDTLYLQKFDVEAIATNTIIRQYMQNICAPSSEARNIYKLYNNVNAVDNVFVFKIPVYNNMPESCPLPVRKFSDVDTNAWYYSVVEYVYDNGIMEGVSSDANGLAVFWPDSNLTREMFITTLWKKEKVGEVRYDASFADVSASEWYTSAVSWGKNNNIVNGIDDNTFGVGLAITREQIATMLYRYAKEFKGYEVSARADLNDYLDGAQVSIWAEEAMKWAVSTKIINGKPDKSGNAYLLEPASEATRAECAAMVERFVKYYE